MTKKVNVTVASSDEPFVAPALDELSDEAAEVLAELVGGHRSSESGLASALMRLGAQTLSDLVIRRRDQASPRSSFAEATPAPAVAEQQDYANPTPDRPVERTLWASGGAPLGSGLPLDLAAHAPDTAAPGEQESTAE